MRTVRKRGRVFLMEDLPSDEFDFWSAYEAGWEDDTHDMLDRYHEFDVEHRSSQDPESVFIDVGAWVGPITLYAAPYFDRVIALEPDPVAREHLSSNIRRNGVSNCVQLSDALGGGEPVWLGVKPTGAMGDSMTSALYGESGIVTFQTPTTTLWDLHRRFNLSRSSIFIKMDIEGAEADVLTVNLDYLNKVRPEMWLSLHAPLVHDTDAYYRKLQVVSDLYGYAGPLPTDFSSIHLGGLGIRPS